MITALKYCAFFLLGSASFLACSQKEKKTQQKINFDKFPREGSINIVFNQAEITVRNFQDSITYEHWRLRDSLVADGVRYIPFNRKIEKAKLTTQEKDSMYIWARKMVQVPVWPKRFCTDYVGYVSVSVVYSEQVTQACRYKSVCEWESVSPEAQKLNRLIKSKFSSF